MALADFARSLEDGINRRGIVKKRADGWVPEIIPYAGYGSAAAVKIMARALMVKPKNAPARLNLNFLLRQGSRLNIDAVRDFARPVIQRGAQAQRGWRQFFTTQVGFLPVTVRIGKKIIHTRTDRNGYLDLLVEGHGLQPGWQEVNITPLHGKCVPAPVMIVPESETTGIVSDVDDTIMVTWLPRPALAAWNSFVKHTNTRQAVSGMAELYREILAKKPDVPIFYLSTGAWNTYSTLLEFISAYRYPVGPLLLTDWGPTPTGLFRSGSEHKKTQLRNLLIMFPRLKWILVGDDGQHDPLIYDELAREHPSRVKIIMLRELGTVEQVLSHGTPEATEPSRNDSDIERQGTLVVRGKDGYAIREKLLGAAREIFA